MDPNQTSESGNMSRSSTSSNGSPSSYRSDDPLLNRDHHSIAYAVQALIRDMTVLIEREGLLLRTELSEKVSIVKTSGIDVILALGLMLFGVQALVAAAIFGLAYVFDWWLAATIVGIVLLAVGLVTATKFKKSLNFDNLKPTKSTDALSEIGAKIMETAHEFYH